MRTASKFTWAGVLIAFAYVQLEVPRVIEMLWPDFAARQYYPFIDNSYHFSGTMYMVWWLKYCSIDLKNIIVMSVAAGLLWQYSRRLGSIFLSYTLYHVIDHFMLWYNYRTSQWVYLLENGCIILSIILLFTVKERKGAKVKSLI